MSYRSLSCIQLELALGEKSFEALLLVIVLNLSSDDLGELEQFK